MRLRVLLLSILMLSRVLLHSSDAQRPFDPTGLNTNGLGMHFVPVRGTNVQFSAYQTRVKDFRAFVRETGYVHMRETSDPDSRMWSLDRDGLKQRGNSWEDPGFPQTGDHPVVGVSWYDAKAFCNWLTLRERAAGRLPTDREYRLPTDHEWSMAVGLEEEDPAKTPQEKDQRIPGTYPRGEWPEGKPPPAGAGNYAGEETDDGHWPAKFKVISGYNDGFPRTAPVGSFKPNHGMFDLGSNVMEWCEEIYKPGSPDRVLRGASWDDGARGALLSSNRSHDSPAHRSDDVGFRCVEAPFPLKR